MDRDEKCENPDATHGTYTHKKVKGGIKVAFRGMFVLDTCTE